MSARWKTVLSETLAVFGKFVADRLRIIDGLKIFGTVGVKINYN
jgi:hypothetical protein